MVSYEF